MDELKGLVFRLCAAPGTPGNENAAAKAAGKELSKYAKAHVDKMGNVIAKMGKLGAEKHILLDAHLDQIGLIVTNIDKHGFLRVDRTGGVDRRVLPGSPVTIYGKEVLTGVVCCTPPHLSDGSEDKLVSVDKMAVDAGLSKAEAEKLVRPGDRILLHAAPKSLLGTRVTAPGLDDRAGVAVLIRCAQLLAGCELNCEVTVLLSSREEVGGQGAVTGAYSVNPTHAVIVDVSFAEQPNVLPEKCGKLGGGPMIGVAPILNRSMIDGMIETAKKNHIPYKLDVMGGSTGTNSDEIAITRKGVKAELISIPLRYMHTPVEVIDLKDVEHTARLIAEYIKGVE
ncbi:M42 family peptidase [Caproiciproducens sp. AGMB10547]|uniref:M42 family peptidase n=2 Tax=Caproiciproducens faecalis TaxID=2820301 RepID=A0ABS7DN15_9FIRM|nr:M42 family peptidase [Caproiciproducens faecalis]